MATLAEAATVAAEKLCTGIAAAANRIAVLKKCFSGKQKRFLCDSEFTATTVYVYAQGLGRAR